MIRTILAIALLAPACAPLPNGGGSDDPSDHEVDARIPSCDELSSRTLIDVFEVEPPTGARSSERYFRAELWPTGEDVTEAASWTADDAREIEFTAPGVAILKVVSAIPLPFEVAFCDAAVTATVSSRRY